MKKIIASNVLNKYPSASSIISELTTNISKYDFTVDSTLYFGFPKFVGYEEDVEEPDLLILSPNHGVFILRFTDEVGLDTDKIEDMCDELFGLLFSKLNESKLLRKKRQELQVPIDTYIYLENAQDIDSEYICSSLEEIADKLEQQKKELTLPLNDNIIGEVKSIIEGTKALSSMNKRSITANDTSSMAYIISKLENEIKTFDFEQLQSGVTIIDGPQRIRGLAGSGKTVVLAMKAAQIHINQPTKNILITFYTKSLYQQIKNLITKFYRHYKKIDPDWTKIHIKHAWGGAGIDGVYYSACQDNGIKTISFGQAKNYNYNAPFDYICQKAVETGRLQAKYDYVLIDEAQDMPTYFFRLIYNITKFNENIPDEKNIIWGYDELQNIFRVKTKTAKELFGSDNDGLDFIDLDRASHKIPHYLKNDIVLYKCYRNPRAILLVAHALGFGIYNKEGKLPVQALENKEHWEDFGYKALTDVKVNTMVEIERPEENSPLSINRYVDEKELIQHYSAETVEEEVEWIKKEIIKFLADGLNPEDILVISLDDRNAKEYFNKLTNQLIQKDILVNNLLLNPYTSTIFSQDNHITLSTVHRAKGNEAPVVFVIGIDALYKNRDTRSARNKLFTAFTRTKGWLRVSGIERRASYFFHEIDIALSNFPKLIFKQPSLEEVDTIQRDLSDKSKKMTEIKKKYYAELKEAGFSNEEIAEQMKESEKI